MSLKKTAVSGMKWTTFGTVGRSVFQIIQISILTRFLPKEAFGLVAMALFVVQFSNIFVDMGMTSAILHRQDATKKEYSTIYWLNIFISLLLYGFIYSIAPLAAKFYNEPELISLVPVLGLNLLILAAGRQHRTIMQKQFEFASIAKTELLSYFIGLVSAVIFAIKGFGLYSLVYSTLLSSLISNGLFLLLNLRINPISFHFNIKEIRPFLKVGGYTMGSSLLDFFSREIDVLIIGKLLGSEKLGVYSLAKQIVSKIYSIVNPILMSVLSPILASIQKDKNRVKSLYIRVIDLLANINFPIYLLIIIISKELLIVLYGPEYSSGYLVLSFLAFSYAINTINNPVGSLQITTGRTDLGLKWTVLRLLITPIAIFIAAKFSLNIVAGTLALLSLVLLIPLWWVQINPMINISLIEYMGQFYKPLSSMIIVGILFHIGLQYFELPFDVILNAFIKVLVALFLYSGLLMLTDKSKMLDRFLYVKTIIYSKKHDN